MSIFRFARPEARGLPDMRELFLRVFIQVPRSGDWSDQGAWPGEAQLCLFLEDFTGQSNSLAFGLYEDACRAQGLRFPEYAVQDLSACTQNLLLEAEHLNLGAVWMGIAPLAERMRAVAEILGLGPEVWAFALVAVGYPLEKPAPHDRFDESRVQWR